MASVAIRSSLLVVSTIASPSKAASLGLSPISTTVAKQTETPKKLKSFLPENNNEEDDAPPGFQRSDSWNSRAGFSPRPQRPNNNPGRRPVQSASSIHALRLAEEGEEIDMLKTTVCEKPCEDEDAEPSGLSNQAHLERIQEAENSDDETENDSQDGDSDSEEHVDEYDGDGEDDEMLQLYKSFSGDLVVRYNAGHRSHKAFDNDDDDIVRI